LVSVDDLAVAEGDVWVVPHPSRVESDDISPQFGY
jgi:hypothetical protein